MRRRIHLHGRFKAYHPGPIEVVAETIWEAVEAVVSQVKGFRPDPHGGKQRIQVVGHTTIESLKAKSDVEDIHITPAMVFGKNGGIFQTIIGIALVVASFFVGGPAWIATALLSSGIAMTAGGIIQLLSPQPQLGSNDADQKRSKYLNSSANTVKIGTTIGLGYGLFRLGGQIMSLNIDAKDVGI